MRVTDYWERELMKSCEMALNIEIKPIEFPSKVMRVYQISYDSLHDERIFGWFLEPKTKKTYPLVIDYIGYMNHLESPLQFMHWISVGCAVLVTDSRGQGGMTLDQEPYETYNEKRLMACGFLNKEDFYLRRLYWDAFRLIDVAHQLPGVLKNNIFAHGTSQGGGIGLFVNSITPHPIKYGFYDVPSHSNLNHRVEMGTGSYEGIHDYLKEHNVQADLIRENLEFFDIVHVVGRIDNPVLISVGMADPICPKEDFFKAYQNIRTYKELDIYPVEGHGGGGYKHIKKILTYLLKEIEDC